MYKIYYIEDLMQHLTSLSALLRENGYTVYPSEDEWSNELNSFLKFIHNQSSNEEKLKLEEIFLKYNPDLLIIDVSLGVDLSGSGEDIYRNFVLKSETFRSIPVIYLTITGKSNIKLYNKTRHVLKVLDSQNLDVEAIKKDLLDNISDLLRTSNNKGLLNNIIESI